MMFSDFLNFGSFKRLVEIHQVAVFVEDGQTDWKELI
jgi:hypothetical protein